MVSVLINDILIIFGISAVSLFLCSLLKIPSIIGLLFAGLIAGTNGFGWISNSTSIQAFADIGIILLLFTIGVQFSLKEMLENKKSAILGGILQVGLPILASFLIAKQMGLSVESSIFIGFIISLSSTAIVFNILQKNYSVNSPHGKITLGILIFQDIVVVLMLLFTPLLAGGTQNILNSFLIFLIKGLLILILVFAGSKWIVPAVLFQVTKTKSKELFLLSVVLLCFAVAWLTSSIGLSVSLGAFLAGLIISESIYGDEALAGITPFRDIFASFFFISIGMLLDIQVAIQHPWIILLATLGVLTLKSFIAGITTLIIGFPLRSAILVGFSLSQIGEFSFILAMVGVANGLLTNDFYQIFLAVSILTMAVTPVMMSLSSKLADKFPQLKHEIIKKENKKNHLVVIGYGFNGRNLIKAAKLAKIPYSILEINSETVCSEKKKREPIYYGDATKENVLESLNIKEAKVIVIAISDSVATRRIVHLVRKLNPKAYIVARTLYIKEMDTLLKLGADVVIPEEFETSIEIFNRVMSKFSISKSKIDKFISKTRLDNYRVFEK